MELGERFIEALGFAARLHLTQKRKGSETPYVAHLLGVCALVLEHGGTEDEAVAALLHDAVEDQGNADTLGEIGARFGSAVAEIVRGCSDALERPKPPWRERKERAIAEVAAAPRSVLLVETADKLHNARAVLGDYRQVGEKLWERFMGKRAGTLWYYRAMTDALTRAWPGPLTDELARTVAELERLAAATSVPPGR
jgi:(p)ppGpp synthase/HD superfamily hydrolase